MPPDFASQFAPGDSLESQPLKGLRVGIIRETLGDGVDAEVISSIQSAASHFEDLGCTVTEVLFTKIFLRIYLTGNSVEVSSLYGCRSHSHPSPLDCQHITYLLHLSHLPTYLVMMVLGNALCFLFLFYLSTDRGALNILLSSVLLTFRYGNQVFADELISLYGDSRAKGFGSEVCIIA